MPYKDILFDLDGTLIASDEGILNCVEYALERLGKSIPKRDELTYFIGPPLLESFETLPELSKEESLTATDLYRQRFEKEGIFECAVYPGIPALLENLTKAGFRLHLATAKPLAYARQILERLSLASFFTSTDGIPLDIAPYSKAEIIGRILSAEQINPTEAVMVGDRLYDMEGAQACGIDSIGVLYGYGSREELETAGATHIVATVPLLQQMLLGG